MKFRKSLIVAGILVAVLSLLGIPNIISQILLAIIGLYLIGIGLRRQRDNDSANINANEKVS